ncbi:MAG: HTH domain-containing protein, partial [Alkaliphilus sp.]
MSKNLFSQEEISVISQNKYVKNISSKAITYTSEFRRLFIAENRSGKLPRTIFEECGFDVDIIGIERVSSSAGRWRRAYNERGVLGLDDTRIGNSGRELKRE